MNNRAVGIKRRGRARGNSHLSSGAEGAKEKGDGRAGANPNETTLPGEKTVTDRPTEMRTYIPAPWGGGDGRRADGRPATAPGNVMRAGRLKSSRGAPYFLKNSALVAGFFTAPILAKNLDFNKKIRPEYGQRRREMEQTITIRTNRTTHLTVATLRVYQCLKDKLQDRAEVVDYRKIADEVGMSWNGVKYAVSALIRYGFIKKEGGKLSVNPSSPEVVGDYRTEAGG